MKNLNLLVLEFYRVEFMLQRQTIIIKWVKNLNFEHFIELIVFFLGGDTN